ncbi:MAG: protein tyrosine phosphatase [Devosiaceae bacterium]|nr:protein tyrosine phosphatase [Devosiaceae bacterium MH13]
MTGQASRLKQLYKKTFPSRRVERTNRFEPPLVGSKARFGAWVDMLFVDHGFIRYAYTNFHQISSTPGREVYRSSQPLPHQVARWGRMGIKTIINLRGGRHFGSYPLEVEAADKAGIAFEELALRSRALPTVAELDALAELFATATYPILVHCKAGADRASLASALYFLLEHSDLEAALGQMRLRYGHIKGAKTGVLDAMLETYARDGHAQGKPFMQWVREDYDPAAIAAAFKPRLLGTFFGDTLLDRE